MRTRLVSELELAADGEFAAYTVRETAQDDSVVLQCLYVVRLDGIEAPRKLLEAKAISGLKWRPDHRELTYIDSDQNKIQQVWAIHVPDGARRQITRSATGISEYEWRPDGLAIAFLTSHPQAPQEREQIERQGVVVEDGWGGGSVQHEVWRQGIIELRTYDVQRDRETSIKIYRAMPSLGPWSPNARFLLTYTPSLAGDDKRLMYTTIDLLAADAAAGVRTMEVKAQIARPPLWSPRGDRLAVLALPSSDVRPVWRRMALFVVDISSERLDQVTPASDLESYRYLKQWSADSDSVIVEGVGDSRMMTGLFRVPFNGAAPRWLHQDQEHHASCSPSANTRRAACVYSTATTPPDVVAVDLDSVAPRARRRLTDLNPHYRDVSLTKVQELRVTNSVGVANGSLLVYPRAYTKGQRYPLLIVLYRVSSPFLVDQFGNYPIHLFAAHGHAVAVVSIVEGLFRSSDPDAGQEASAGGPLSSIERTVQTIVDMGIADPHRVGIMGWSYGSFLTDYAITHSKVFAAASSGDGGLYNPGTYWMASEGSRAGQEITIGGPPYGDSYAYWQAMSPSLNAANVSVPLLMEYASSSFFGMEFYTALKRYKRPVEMVIYPGAPHVFRAGSPHQRRASLTRNLDWFNYWLYNRRDPAPAKVQQYQRWDRIRANQQLATPPITVADDFPRQ